MFYELLFLIHQINNSRSVASFIRLKGYPRVNHSSGTSRARMTLGILAVHIKYRPKP
jgi:hypothetical protein